MDNPLTRLDRANLWLSVLTLLLVLALIVLSLSNRSLQRQLQAQQIQINNGRVTQQVATTVIREMAQTGVNSKDQELLNLLRKHGFDVKATSNSTSTGNSSNQR